MHVHRRILLSTVAQLARFDCAMHENDLSVGFGVPKSGARFRRGAVRHNGSVHFDHGQRGLRSSAGLPSSRRQADTHAAHGGLCFSHNELEHTAQAELERLLRTQGLLLRGRTDVGQEESEGRGYERCPG